jgi:hypothetical protein
MLDLSITDADAEDRRLSLTVDLGGQLPEALRARIAELVVECQRVVHLKMEGH